MIGDVPLAVLLWKGGMSFGGVIAFMYADLLILPILNTYRKSAATRSTTAPAWPPFSGSPSSPRWWSPVTSSSSPSAAWD
ncbi:permease [Streptomyces mirabilis]|uniref:permease n=1 Tax=Streptomyces mirabilis TaxID=68239 RepID=UPI00363F7D38